MSSFSSTNKEDTHSASTFKNRMAARKRANLETERQAKIMSRRQSKKRVEHRRSTQLRLKEIQKERQRLRDMLGDNENKLSALNGATTSTTASTTASTIASTTATTTLTKHARSSGKLPVLRPTRSSALLLGRSSSSSSSSSSSTSSSTSTSTSTTTKLKLSQRPADLSSPGNQRNYKRVRNLGRGAFGAVTAAKSLDDGKIYAIKAIAYRGTGGDTINEDRQRALKEVRALRQLSDHPCVVGLRDAFESKCTKKLFIVAEFCESGSLHERLKSARRSVERNGWDSGKLESKLISSWFFQLVSAVEHLHSRNVLHRDIKPANIFMCAGATQIKLGDFGLVGVLENSMDVIARGGHVGTPTYNMTPELLKTGGVSKPADIWSVGAVLHECLTLEQPYTQNGRGLESIVQLGQQILNTNIDQHERLLSYPIGLRDLSSHHCCMSKNPKERPTASEVLECSYILRSMKYFLGTKHITPPPVALIQLVKNKVLLGEASKIVDDLKKGSVTTKYKKLR